jgi:glycosyltransferase involved in cell wall biosynthesis
MRRWSNRHSMLVAFFFLAFYLLRKVSSYDVIYARDYHATAMAIFTRVLFKKRIAFEVNGLASEEQMLSANSFLRIILVKTIKKIEHLASRFSDKVIAVTPQIASYLIHDFQCPFNKIAVIGNGVNMKRFYPIHDRGVLATARKDLGIKEKDAVIIFVGNLAPWQGVEHLIKAAPELVDEVKDLKFLIVGDGVLRHKIEVEVNHKRMSGHFLITGMVEYSKIPLYINIGDICVLLKRKLPSGFSPLKLYEYMACGKPILASRVEGLEFIEKEGIGRLIEPNNPGEVKKALYEMIKNEEERINMGLRSLRLAREKFSWESKAIEIEKILEVLG